MDRVRLNGEGAPHLVTDAAGNEWLVFELLNPDEAVFLYTNPAELDPNLFPAASLPFEQTRDFWSIYFSLDKRFSNNWQMMGSYVYGRSTGTDDTNVETDGRGSAVGFSDLWSDPNLRFFADGSTTSDVPHQIKIAGSAIFPYEILAGFFYNGRSGQTWTKSVRFRNVPGSRRCCSRFVEPRGSNRLPWQNNLDLRAEKAFTIGRTQVSILLDIFNVLNIDTVTRVRDREDARSNFEFGRVLAIKFPRRFRLGFRMDF